MDNDVRRIDAEIARLIAEQSKAGGDGATFLDVAKRTGLDADLCKEIADVLDRHRTAAATVKCTEPLKVAIVGGAGKMGAWFSDLLSSAGHEITVIDPASGNNKTLEDCKDSDVVIVSVPIHSTLGILERLDTICKKDALIFDLASLKTPIVDQMRKMSKTRKVCSIHPMFGPSAESMMGRNLIICDCGNSEATNMTEELLSGRGGNLRIMDIEQHDVFMSYVLGLSHAVNIAFFTALDRSGLSFRDLESVASTTLRKNLDTNVSVALEDPVLYYEIQHMNQHRDDVWNVFAQAVEDVRNASLSDDPSAFIEIMNNGRNYFTKQ